jgi:putative ABC transport system permease protein
MWKNHILIAIRTLLKNRGTSLINVLGLTVGVASCMLILLFVGHELSYEKWNPESDRIVRTFADIKFGGADMRFAVSGAVVGPDVAKDLPEVESFCRFRNYGTYLMKKPGEKQQNFSEPNVLTVDSTFFTFFPTKVIHGNALNCLVRPNEMAISETAATKFFGESRAAIGQTLILDNDEEWKISAVFQDLPKTTHFKTDFLLSMTGNRELERSVPYWATSNNFHTYLMMRKGVSFEDFEKKFASYSTKKIEETAQVLLGMNLEQFNASGQHARYELQKLTDIHLRSDLDIELEPNGSIEYVWIFGAIAFFILLIACINYMNLTTARSTQRAKEIGVRKVLGSRRKELMTQFLSESFLVTTIAFLLALALSYLILPSFAKLTDRDISVSFGSPTFLSAFGIGIVIVTLLAGTYPAFFLSGFKPMRMLRGNIGGSTGQRRLRSLLVVFQFISSTTLIVGTMLVYNQLKFIQNKKLGFEKEQVVILDDAYGLGPNLRPFKEEMLKQPGVESATISSFLPVPSSRSDNSYSTSREFRMDNTVNMQQWRVDFTYVQTMGMKIIEGRYFDPAFPTDSFAVVLNQTAVEKYGFDEPIGKKIYVMKGGPKGAPSPEDFVEYTVVGIVEDFHFSSLRDNIGALGFHLEESSGKMAFRYRAEESKSVLESLESNFQRMAPGQVFSYSYMDEDFANMYETEQKIGTIGLLFAFLAIFVSCLGLLGLASFIAEQRTKEIGVRKVLGASIFSIVALLSKNFMKLIIIAVVIAIPLAWYFMRGWLGNFAYSTKLSWGVFFIAALIAIGIALLTLAIQSTRAAMANPVDSLRSE